MPEPLSQLLDSAAATEAAGSALARAVQAARPEKLCIALEGELGAGKTTFARGFLRGLGYEGRVPSPTYTLVEPYDCPPWQVAHMDLYRLQDGAELEYLGVAELDAPGHLLLVEWPSRAGDSLPESDLEIQLKVVSEGRLMRLTTCSDAGSRVAAAITL